MDPEAPVVIEVFGEGKTDVRPDAEPGPPSQGVVPILMHRLCGRPPRMRVKRKAVAFLQGKGLRQKVRFAKRQARYNRSDGVVFMMDSEGDETEFTEKKAELEHGRDSGLPDFPMAVGVAQPCIESWLLADATAIRRGLALAATPAVPEHPEALPAPCRDRMNNPKSILCRLSGENKQGLSADEADRVALAMNDMGLVRLRCPLSFAAFAEEIGQRIQPLF